MEERKYTFYDRYQKVKYANITVEELEVLNISYNKEHYMFDQQHQRNNTVLFCGLESENSCATDFIADDGRDIASDITTEIFFKELFSDLTEKEKKIVSDYFIMGKQVKETATELGISTRQVSRDKNSALAKMLKRMKAAGYESYAEAAGAFLQESDYIPTQMETQNSIMKKRRGAVMIVYMDLENLLKEKNISKNKLCEACNLQRTQLNNYCKNKVTRIDFSVIL